MTADQTAREEDPDAFLIAGMSVEIVREAVTTMPALFVSAIVAYSAARFFGKALLTAAEQIAHVGAHALVLKALTGLCGLLALDFVDSAILASVAIAIHRLILRDEKALGVISPISSRVLLFTLWLVALRMPTYLNVALLYLTQSGSHPAVLLAAGGICLTILATVYVGVRTSLVFPAIAIDAPSEGWFDRIACAWRLSKGRFWRLMGSGFMAVLPMFILFFVIEIVVLLILAFVMYGATGQMSSVIELVRQFEFIADGFFGVFGAALGAAALSWNYRIVRARPRP